jgi:hypothetical protein
VQIYTFLRFSTSFSAKISSFHCFSSRYKLKFLKKLHNPTTFIIFAPESIKSSSLLRLTRQPSFGNHGGQYDAEATFINFKTFQFMQQHIYYIRYALRFADMQISELVSVFNDQVQNRGWSSMRAYHDHALIDEFQRRGIDVSAIYDGKAISFARPVRYDIADNRLATIG